MFKAVRIYLDGGRDPHDNMTLDVIIDGNRYLRPSMSFSGWWGKLGSTDLIPVVLLADGRVDPGSDENTAQSERFGFLNIHAKPVELLSEFRFEIWGDEHRYKVTKLVDLCE